MNLSTHIAVGAAVGYVTKNPALGFLAGYASHHLIDALPHTDGGSLEVSPDKFLQNKSIIIIVSIDFIALLIIAYICYMLHGLNAPMVWGAVGAAIPDLIDNMPFWSVRLRQIFPFNYYHRFHEFLHYTIKNNTWAWAGVLIQLILIFVSIELLV